MNEGGASVQKQVLTNITKELYASGTPTWVLETVMERVAAGIMGGGQQQGGDEAATASSESNQLFNFLLKCFVAEGFATQVDYRKMDISLSSDTLISDITKG